MQFVERIVDICLLVVSVFGNPGCDGYHTVVSSVASHASCPVCCLSALETLYPLPQQKTECDPCCIHGYRTVAWDVQLDMQLDIRAEQSISHAVVCFLLYLLLATDCCSLVVVAVVAVAVAAVTAPEAS